MDKQEIKLPDLDELNRLAFDSMSSAHRYIEGNDPILASKMLACAITQISGMIVSLMRDTDMACEKAESNPTFKLVKEFFSVQNSNKPDLN